MQPTGVLVSLAGNGLFHFGQDQPIGHTKSPGCPSPGPVRTTSRALSRLCDCVPYRCEWISWAAHQHTRNPGSPKSPSEKAQHNCQNNCAECQTASTPCLERASSTQAYLAVPVSPVPGQRHLRVRLKPGPLVAFRSCTKPNSLRH